MTSSCWVLRGELESMGHRQPGPHCDAGGDVCMSPASIPAHVLGSPPEPLRIALLAQALGSSLAPGAI